MADNSNTPLFVIAIGGTGMRCLESFVHLCAIGMFDNKEIHILTLDTDYNNGNKERVETLIQNYIEIKRGNGKEYGQANTNTFFSSVLKIYNYATNYNGDARNSYESLARSTTGLTDEQNSQNKDLADLFLDKDTVQAFNLTHGYRAQTHLGSMLMYHSIVESAKNGTTGSENTDSKNNKDLDTNLCDFIDELTNATDARVFIFGSIFGGTGASSIPIIPKAFQRAVEIRAKIKGGSGSLDFEQIRFGAALLTDYFTFRSPQQQQKEIKGNQVIADSANFALNCQAAMDYYIHDTSVRKCYKRFYHVGWPMTATKYGEDSNGEVLTGGNNQKNACHVVELMCACAAYDFFSLDNAELKDLKFCYRSPEFDQSYKFTGKDFMGTSKKRDQIFTNKIGAFLSFAHIALSKYGGAKPDRNGIKELITFFESNGIPDYSRNEEWNDTEMYLINNYLKEFAYQFGHDGSFIPGWLFQVYQSVGQGTFLFKDSAFEQAKIKNQDVDMGDIFLEDGHQWCDNSIFQRRNSGRSFDKLMGELKQESTKQFEGQNVSTTEEKFLAHIFNVITVLQKFKLK